MPFSVNWGKSAATLLARIRTGRVPGSDGCTANRRASERHNSIVHDFSLWNSLVRFMSEGRESETALALVGGISQGTGEVGV